MSDLVDLRIDLYQFVSICIDLYQEHTYTCCILLSFLRDPYYTLSVGFLYTLIRAGSAVDIISLDERVLNTHADWLSDTTTCAQSQLAARDSSLPAIVLNFCANALPAPAACKPASFLPVFLELGTNKTHV